MLFTHTVISPNVFPSIGRFVLIIQTTSCALQPTPSASLSRSLHWVGYTLWMSSMGGCLHWMSSILANDLCNPTVRVIWKGSWQMTWPIPLPENRNTWCLCHFWEMLGQLVKMKERPSGHLFLLHASYSHLNCSPGLNLNPPCQAYGEWSKTFLSSTFYLPFTHLVCLKTVIFSFEIFSYLN